MQFRFLNLSNHVQAQSHINISTSFQETIEHINVASNTQELSYIAQNFFQEHLNIPKNLVTLHVRNENYDEQSELQQKIECFLNNEKLPFNPTIILTTHKILVSQEVKFDAFYTDNELVTKISQFLDTIDCDIFVPIFNSKKLIGYITVAQQKQQVIYNFEQQNKIIVFAQFLAPAIHLLEQQNIYAALEKSKSIEEQLYAKHQEISQYKESIKTLLKDRVENHIGIVFYKAGNFILKNQEAQNLIGVNPHAQPHHPTIATLKNFAQQIEKFKTTSESCITVQNGKKIIVSGMPHAEMSGGVILTIRCPEATDIITMQLDALKDHSKRDYLLYLETTQAGQMINQLLPSNTEFMLHIKISLLEAALQKEALLLQAHYDDVQVIAEMLHHITQKTSLQVLQLQGEQNDSCAIKLFGINELLEREPQEALIEKAHGGTLLIQNIERLDKISQQKLAYFIRYGIYTPCKSDQRKFSDCRIICATSYEPEQLLQEGKIIPELYSKLKINVTLPSLISMNYDELSNLADGFMHQTLQTPNNASQPLSIKEKEAVLEKHIPSLSQFKQKIQLTMQHKSYESKSPKQDTFRSVPKLDAGCPELQLAAQLGKHALKDMHLMKKLWNKLGSQTKIADLLGVNRSSVNRRCKDYNLV